ncbi:hypothetical protein VU02_00815, partial [Desulfobulbus sp. N2]|nr:hypothetical protein [Desulfobulbus sp. N2]
TARGRLFFSRIRMYNLHPPRRVTPNQGHTQQLTHRHRSRNRFQQAPPEQPSRGSWCTPRA